MSKVTISAELFALLRAVDTKCELVGPDGQPAGFFTPPEGDDVTLEELKAADAAGGEYTMGDVFKLLEKDK